MSECKSEYTVRFPDAPVDDWETHVCIQDHGESPFTPGIIHNSGDGTQWIEVDGFRTHGVLELRDDRDTLKMLRETLCEAQAIWQGHGCCYVPSTDDPHIERIQRLVDEIDRQRPLGPDGTHGDLHTPTCGCDHV